MSLNPKRSAYARWFSPLAASIVPLILLLAPNAQAGGLYFFEFGHPLQGASNAGANAIAQDASTAFTNPAGIMSLDDSELMVTALGVFPSNEFEQEPGTTVGANGNPLPGSGSNGGDAGVTAVGGALFYAKPMSEKWGWGFTLVSISGAGLDYEDAQDFVGRYWATEVDLLTVSALPSVAYQLTDSISVAAGLPVMFGSLDMDIAVPAVFAIGTDGKATVDDGNDTSVSIAVSALWEVTDRVNLGLAYLGKNEVSFDSDLSVTLPPGGGVGPEGVSADLEWTFPQTLRLSASSELGDRLTVLASVAWEDWSSMDDILLVTDAISGSLPRDWDDTWHFSLGLRWRPGNQWTYYTGIAYDTDPTSADKRTADMPIDEQWRLSAGATYEWREDRQVGAVITYADYGDARIENGGNRPVSGIPWQVVGEFDTNRIIFLGLNFLWK